MDDKRFWVGLTLVRGIGAVSLRALIEHFGDAASAWQGSSDELRAAGMGSKVLERLLEARKSIDLDQLWDQIIAQEIKILTWEDEFSPPRLKEIEQPPPVLYVQGELLPEDHFAVAIVGTRKVTPYGRQVTEELSAFLAANGVTVISGLARGVNAVAHSHRAQSWR
jgi:DNA processing protein